MSISPSLTFGRAAPRRRSFAQIALVVVALAAAAMRIAEVPAHPLALVRIAISLAAVAFLLFGPVATLGRRAVAIIAIEALCGITTFVLVDAPFVLDHQRQIGMVALSLGEKIERAERPGELLTR